MTEPLLTVPPRAGRTIVEAGAVFARPLLGTDPFAKFCSDRGLAIDRKRLIRLERLGLFAPVFRVRTPRKPTGQFRIPPTTGENWFSKRWARDTTAIPRETCRPGAHRSDPRGILLSLSDPPSRVGPVRSYA